MADGTLHSRGGRRSSVSEPPEFHWLAPGGSLTLDHQPPTHRGSATKLAEEPMFVVTALMRWRWQEPDESGHYEQEVRCPPNLRYELMSKHCNLPHRQPLPRREFLKLTTAVAAGSAVAQTPIMAGPFETTNDYLRLISADKKLDPRWVRSLFERGEKEVYSHPDALRHIGMPVGGLFAGTVYLGGDGRLWLWNIFNQDQEGIAPREITYLGTGLNTRDGANYIKPAEPVSPFHQGFVVRANGEQASFDLDGFADVTFRGEYPRAIVSYSKAKLPVSARLEAFSPFIPLNADDSSLPATVMSYTVKNEGAEPLEIGVFGHLQNAVCLQSGENAPPGQRRNRVVRGDRFTAVECSANSQQPQAAPRTGHPF